jgi:predicted RNase H-like nuclease
MEDHSAEPVHPVTGVDGCAGGWIAVTLSARRELLAGAGIALPPKVAGAAEDDLLDAAAVAWSARRIAAGRATVLTCHAQRADDGTEIAIRY